MAPRQQLQKILEDITDNVYFQPPTNTVITYPCIIYKRDGSNSEHADNKLYVHTKRYQVTVIDQNPDSDLPDSIIELPLCELDRTFTAENLNHYVFTLFF